jgi:DNA polymerase I-like protein with 3'-5' exonuclease and polymerase domains
MWNDDAYAALDLETSGVRPEYALQPWRVAHGKAWITSTSMVRKTPAGGVFAGGLNPDGYSDRAPADRHTHVAQQLADFLQECAERKRTIVGWNTQFDVQWLLALGLDDLVYRCKWLDGMLLWRHWFIEPEYDLTRNKKRPYGLKQAVAEVLPKFAGYEEDVDFHDESPEARARLQTYNHRDTMFSLRLTKHWFEKLAETPRRLRAATIEADSIPLVAAANLKGMVIDALAARELEAVLTRTAEEKLEILTPHGVTEEIVRSPLKLAQLLFDQWGLPVLKENTGKKTGKVSRATDKEVLHELAFKDPRARELRAYREALNNRTKFAVAPLRSAEYNENLCSHPAAIIFGTYSGRLTYASSQTLRWQDDRGRDRKTTLPTGFALHQEKRGAEFRKVVQAPPGYTIVEFDAAGQEFRWMAIASGDETMLQLCLPGEDPHSFMASRIVSRDYREFLAAIKAEETHATEKRPLGKVANLSLQYRTSAPKLRTVARVQYDLPMELPEARLIHRTYQASYPGVPKYWDRQIAQTKRTGYVETFAGRRVQVVGQWDGPMGWSMGSTSINYRIQGTGADQKYLALSVIRPYLVKIGGYFAWDLHDGIYFYIPDASVDRAVQDMKFLLDNLPYRKAWGFDPPVPLPWDCKAGKTWGRLKSRG